MSLSTKSSSKTNNEICCAIFGKRFGDAWIGKARHWTEGHPSHVFPKSQEIWEDCEKDKLIGFYHTHPGFPAYISEVDDPCMQAWRTSEGNLFCLIEGVDGMKCWEYNSDSRPRETCLAVKIGDYFFGLASMKGL